MFQNQSIDYANGGSRSTNTLASSQVGTSRAIFQGSEDLGGGTKAIFLYEMDFDSTATGANTTAGEIFVGLSGNLGTLKMGAPNTPSMYTQQGRGGQFSTKIGGGRSGFQLSGDTRTRYSDSIQYETPTFGGFKAALNYVSKVSGAANMPGISNVTQTGAITDIGAFYANGPFAAGISNYQQQDVVAHTTAYASYIVGPVKGILGFHTQDTKINGVIPETLNTPGTAGVLGAAQGKSQGWNVGLEYSITPVVTVFGNVARTNDKTAYNRDLEMNAVGVRYDLSKRTSLHARYISEKRDIGTVVAAGLPTAQKTTLIGIRHDF